MSKEQKALEEKDIQVDWPAAITFGGRCEAMGQGC